MQNNRTEHIIDLKDLFSKKIGQAADASEKGSARINKAVTSIATNSDAAVKKVHDNMQRMHKDIDSMAADAQARINKMYQRAMGNVQHERLPFNRDYAAYRRGMADSTPGVFNSLRKNSFNFSAMNSGIASMAGELGVGGLALAGGGLATAALPIAGGFALIKSKIGEAAIEYDKFLTAFNNTMGSRGGAKQLLKDISEYAPNLGMTFSELSDSILKFQTGNEKAFESIGVQFEEHKGKLTAVFKGERTEIENTIAARTNYIINLAKSGKAVSDLTRLNAQYKNNIHQLWESLGKRLNPALKGSMELIGGVSAQIAKWVEVPLSEELQDEADHLRVLKTELMDTNIPLDRRKEIIDEIQQKYGDYLKNINLEKATYEELNKALDNTILLLDKKSQKARLDEILKDAQGELSGRYRARAQSVSDLYKLGNQVAPDVMKMEGLTTEQRIALIEKAYRGSGKYGEPGGSGETLYDFKRFKEINSEIGTAQKNLRQVTQDVQKQMKDEGLFGLEDPTKTGGKTTTTTAGKSLNSGVNGVSGGASVKNINISIGQLVGEVNNHQTKLSENMKSAKDIVVEALLTAVNDANLAAN